MVMVAVLEELDVFAVKLAVRVALPEPEVGLSVSQEALSVALQDTLELIEKVVEPEVLATLRLLGDTEMATPACVTVIVRVIPPPVIVTVPVRDDWLVFAVTLMFICVVLLALPLVGLIVIQD